MLDSGHPMMTRFRVTLNHYVNLRWKGVCPSIIRYIYISIYKRYIIIIIIIQYIYSIPFSATSSFWTLSQTIQAPSLPTFVVNFGKSSQGVIKKWWISIIFKQLSWRSRHPKAGTGEGTEAGRGSNGNDGIAVAHLPASAWSCLVHGTSHQSTKLGGA